MAWERRTGLIFVLFSGLVVAGGVPSWQPPSRADDPPKTAAAQGRLQGRFTAADTGQPVAGAKIRVLIRGVLGKDRVAEVVSGADGRYALDVPLGHLWLQGIHAPAGYYTQDQQAWRYPITTTKEPQATRDFVLQLGVAWQLEVEGIKDLAKNPLDFSVFPNPEPNLEGQGFKESQIIRVTSDAKGKAVLTVSPTIRRHRFLCALKDFPSGYEISTVDVETEEGFDPQKVKGGPEAVKERVGAVRLRDTAGRTAILQGGEARVDAGQVVVRFSAKQIPADEALTFRGIVVDENGKVVEGAKVFPVLICHADYAVSPRPAGSDIPSHLRATTNATGKFELRDVRLPQESFRPDSRVYFAVVAPGLEPAKTKDISLLELKNAGREGDFGTITLKRGSTLRGKVVDEKGAPVEGAVVVPFLSGIHCFSHLTCRTDAMGKFAMQNLSFGPKRVVVLYGEASALEGVEFDAKSEEFLIRVVPSHLLVP